MDKTVIRTEAAPAPFQGAPYNQAIVANGFVYVAGQLGLTRDGTMVEGGIGPQTEQVLANLAAILDEAGSGLDRLVKTTVFLTDLANFAGMNEEWQRWFPDNPPARSGAKHPLEVDGLRISIGLIAEA